MELRELPIELIEPDKFQPRKEFDLTELKESIKENGVLVPIIVQPSEEGDTVKYIIIDGERRYRSSRELGLPVIPAVINKSIRKNRFKDQVIIDHQRHSLTVEEKSAAWSRLLEEYSGSYEAVSTAVGVSVSQVKNVIEGAQFKARAKDLLPEDLGWRERAVIRRTNRIKDDNLRARLVISAIENEDNNKLIDEKVRLLITKILDSKKLSPAEQKIIIHATDMDEAIISIRNMREEIERDKKPEEPAELEEKITRKLPANKIMQSYECPRCGGELEIDSSYKKMIIIDEKLIVTYGCDDCGSLFVVLADS